MQFENSFTGHLGGVELNKRNWNDLFVNVISAYPVQLARGCWMLSSGNISVGRRHAKPALHILKLMFSSEKKIANIHRLPSYCIKARVEQWLSLTTGHQVTFGTPLLNQWLMGHGGWLGRYEKVCIMTVCRVFLSPTHVPTHLPRTCTQAGTQTLNEKQGQEFSLSAF